MLRYLFFLCFVSIIVSGCNVTQTKYDIHEESIELSTKRPSVEQGVNSQRKITLYAGDNTSKSTVDLDESSPTDLQFNITQGSGGKFFLLTPLNGSKAILSGNDQMGYSNCFRLRERMLKAHVNGFSRGDFICLITKTGKISEIRVEQLNTTEDWIEISYTTWEN